MDPAEIFWCGAGEQSEPAMCACPEQRAKRVSNREQKEKGGIDGIETHNSHMFEVILQARLL